MERPRSRIQGLLYPSAYNMRSKADSRTRARLPVGSRNGIIDFRYLQVRCPSLAEKEISAPLIQFFSSPDSLVVTGDPKFQGSRSGQTREQTQAQSALNVPLEQQGFPL
jgi:hypothetical protein